MMKVINIFMGGKKKKHKCKPRFLISIGPVREQNQNIGIEVFMLQLTDTQKCDLAIQPVDAHGHPASVEAGSVAWSSSDSNVVAVNVDPTDELKAVVLANAPGTAQVNVSADADLGSGVVTISGTLDVTVVAGQAVGLSITTGTPTEQ